MSNHSEQLRRAITNNALMSTPHGAASASRRRWVGSVGAGCRRRKFESIIFAKTLDNGNLTVIFRAICPVSQSPR